MEFFRIETNEQSNEIETLKESIKETEKKIDFFRITNKKIEEAKNS